MPKSKLPHPNLDLGSSSKHEDTQNETDLIEEEDINNRRLNNQARQYVENLVSTFFKDIRELENEVNEINDNQFKRKSPKSD